MDVPFQLQELDAGHLDHSKTMWTEFGGTIIQNPGIRRQHTQLRIARHHREWGLSEKRAFWKNDWPSHFRL